MSLYDDLDIDHERKGGKDVVGKYCRLVFEVTPRHFNLY